MLSSLEKTLLAEVLKSRIPSITNAQIESSIQKAESVVTHAESTVLASNNQNSNEYYHLPVIKNEGHKLNIGHVLSTPIFSTSTVASAEAGNLPASHECYYLPIVKGEGLKINVGHVLSTPIFSTSIGASAELEGGILDGIGDALSDLGDILKPAVKPVCQATATAVYNTAITAAKTLDPISQVVALAAAKAVYDKAMEQC
ncbi:hypothetical protein [Bacillus cereus]|uniref:hypothetical protein n=1 Tax=Bacillus cereus TaxID=1396 RepID=UPI000BFC66B4|nr:hypothetical protein [Bacillus cereus]MEB9877491.1 hypothetical protein [Bacillus cereus]PGN85975.1 hypothetical protein CN963_06570 [Bacillus cereus]